MPNIIGTLTYVRSNVTGEGEYPSSGALRRGGLLNTAWSFNNNKSLGDVNFNASWSNSIYGKYGTVVPNSVSCLLFIKF